MNKGAIEYIKSNIRKCGDYKSIFNYINPILTDVSLRDGIQGLNPDKISTHKKMEVFKYLHKLNFVKNIEIGSIVSPKHMPIMNDVPHLYNNIIQYLENYEPLEEMKMASSEKIELPYEPNIYVLIPNLSKLKIAQKHNFTNFAFLTSVSNSFQQRNINKSLEHSNIELYKMLEFLKYNKQNKKNCIHTKLYVSCIDHCPFEGKIDTKDIVTHLINHACTGYYNEVCLSDTCGSLTYISYKNILDELLNYVDPNMISLHLHVNRTNLLNIENIIRHSLNKGVHRFDVSMLNHGGCSMTLSESEKHSNLDYNLFSQILDRYIQENVERLKDMNNI